MMIQRNRSHAHITVNIHTHTNTQTHKHINSALGSICGQSRCRLNADKAAAIGAEMIAVHARGLFLTQFRQQKTAAQQYMLPSSSSSETQSLWCVRRMKAMFFKDRAVKISGFSVDGVGICRGARRHRGRTGRGAHLTEPPCLHADMKAND